MTLRRRDLARGVVATRRDVPAWLAGSRAQLHLPISSRQLHRAVQEAAEIAAKPPFAKPQAALTYLTRYAHRVAISNRRLIAFNETA